MRWRCTMPCAATASRTGRRLSCTSVLFVPSVVCRSKFCRCGSQGISRDSVVRTRLYCVTAGTALPADLISREILGDMRAFENNLSTFCETQRDAIYYLWERLFLSESERCMKEMCAHCRNLFTQPTSCGFWVRTMQRK